MDAQLNFLSLTAANPLSIGEDTPSSPAKAPGNPTLLGKDFANLMRSLLPESERQGLAAGEAMPTSLNLKTQPLSHQFDLITSTGPQPDVDSLAAFAKSQGLADSAVQALFGNLQPLSEKAMRLASMPMGTKGEDNPLPSDQMMATAQPTAAFSSVQANSAWFIGPAAPPMPQAGVGTSSASLETALPISPLTLDTDSGTSLARFAPPAPWPTASTIPAGHWSMQAVNTADNSGLSAPGPLDGPDVGTLSQLLADHGAKATLKINAPAAQLHPASLGEPGPATSAMDGLQLDVMRVRLVPTWENMTRQLANANGTGQAMIWANLVTGGFGKTPTTGAGHGLIDLSDTAIGSKTDTAEGMGTISATFNNDNSAQMARAGDQAQNPNLSAHAGSADTPAQDADRAGQISHLADKLGQALSERLQNQIEQGQWKMELLLKPAHLGKISVELDMRAGGLDAIFRTDNPMTRDLIAQGTHKLRDNLTQAGMTVANVWVNSNNSQNTGGNSTPRQRSESVPALNLKPVDAIEAKKAPNIAKSSDGWDEMV